MEMRHSPVLLRESMEALDIRPGGIYVDGTLGMGGHSEEIARRLTSGHLVAIDRDASAIDFARRRLAQLRADVDFLAIMAGIDLEEG